MSIFAKLYIILRFLKMCTVSLKNTAHSTPVIKEIQSGNGHNLCVDGADTIEL